MSCVLFNVDSNFAAKSIVEIQNMKYCEFEVLSVSSFPSSTMDFTTYFELAKKGGATVYVFLGKLVCFSLMIHILIYLFQSVLFFVYLYFNGVLYLQV